MIDVSDITLAFKLITNIKDFEDWQFMEPPEPYTNDDWSNWCETRNRVLQNYDKMKDLLERVAPISSIKDIGLTEWFTRARQLWSASTAYSSCITQKGDHPAYDAIIAQGMLIVPIILTSFLKNGPDYFFVALHEITGANPVPKKHAGKINVMAYYWILWGIEYWVDFQKGNKLIFVDFTELAIMAGGLESIKNPENSPALKRLMP